MAVIAATAVCAEFSVESLRRIRDEGHSGEIRLDSVYRDTLIPEDSDLDVVVAFLRQESKITLEIQGERQERNLRFLYGALEIGSRRFRLFAEGRRIFVSELIDGKEENLAPADGEDASYTADVVARIINETIA